MRKKTSIVKFFLFFISFLCLVGCTNIKNLVSTNTKTQSNSANTPSSVEEQKSIEALNSEKGQPESGSGAINKTQPNLGTEKSKAVYTIADYYPFQSNVKYIYEGKGMEHAAFITYTDYSKENRIQLRNNNAGTEIVKVLENKNGELKVVFSKEECYYRENFISKTANKNKILLKEPLVVGTSWTVEGGDKAYISKTDVQINTPSGNYKALEVTTEEKQGKLLEYYAVKVGFVKSVYVSKGLEVSSTLSKIEKDKPFTQTISIYYPDGNESRIYVVKENVAFRTNDITKSMFEKYFKNSPGNGKGKLIGANTKIKSLYLGNDGMVYVDFSKELTSEMNAGVEYEGLILRCITNTLGKYYGVNKVYITIEGKPYSSGHNIMNKGEAFIVNTEKCIE